MHPFTLDSRPERHAQFDWNSPASSRLSRKSVCKPGIAFIGHINKGYAKIVRLASDDAPPTTARRRFMAQQKAEAVVLCLLKGFSCDAIAVLSHC